MVSSPGRRRTTLLRSPWRVHEPPGWRKGFSSVPGRHPSLTSKRTILWRSLISKVSADWPSRRRKSVNVYRRNDLRSAA